ncbi:Methylisocitrate lyase [hydrothermal vent metagenome]|uniref:Methylisocitrate lyase n=1 Tax=hydrothermal vent metagenome TaxID=652676 RepID=A0A3B1A2V3_9ZZZZ
MNLTPASLKQALKQEQPLQIAGVINAYCSLLAEKAGFKALYLSGAAVANACFGIPDVGLTKFNDILTEASRITKSCNLPLLVDIDTGFENEVSADVILSQFNDIKVAAIQIEDQIQKKRCGHLLGKKIISIDKMKQRLSKFINLKKNFNIEIMARTDAYSVEGFEATLNRVIEYQTIGADMIFVESLTSIEQYSKISQALTIPVLANITEFGQTPLFSVSELASAKISMVLYPLTAFRVMNQSALTTYTTLKKYGSQKSLIEKMQTRDELYKILNYNPKK